jgi:hypothetical protein
MQPAGSKGGVNYGWQTYEGDVCQRGTCALPAYSGPIAVYKHTNGLCAVVGGYSYRGKQYPALRGVYLFGDWCTGRIFGLLASDAAPGEKARYQLLLDSTAFISSFGEDEAGELYVLDLLGGKIYHIVAR